MSKNFHSKIEDFNTSPVLGEKCKQNFLGHVIGQ
jgi:hypothetical protein